MLTLGLGMAISVAPLTTAVMNAVDQSDAGTAPGINNAASRIAGVLAVAVFGVILTSVFQHELKRKLDCFGLEPAERARIESQTSKLAAVETENVGEKMAIKEAFVTGYHTTLWMAVGLALASSLAAAKLIP